MRVTFDRCELDVPRYELRRDGIAVPVEPQVFDVLTYLVRHRDRVVTKEELLDEVWGDRFVSESALTSRIRAARRAVGDDGTQQRIIRTVHGRGYRFVADAHDAGGVDSPTSPAVRALGDGRDRQRVQFCTTPDGVRLAYASIGEGPTLVKAANWLSHLEYDWESPVWRHWWRDLSADRRLVRYDERGCGLSDWDVENFDVETWVEDLETVVDAAGVDRFALLGVSQGGPVAITYAARHPERVTALVLYGTNLQGSLARARTAQAADEARLRVQLVRLGWGRADPTLRRVFATEFIPSGTLEQWRAFDDLQRRTTSASNAVRFVEAFSIMDAREAARTLRVPTLVLHARGDVRIPVDGARTLAATIAGSRFVSLDTDNHLLLDDEPAWQVFVEEVRAFLAEVDAAR